MAERLESYLEDLHKALSKEIDAPTVGLIVAETEAHLRDRIQALEELGVSPIAAEAEAINLFGDTKHFAREMFDVTEGTPRQRRKPLVMAAIATTMLMAILWPFAMLNADMRVVFPAFLMLVGVAAASYRARQVIPLRLAGIAACGGVVFLFVVSLLFVNLDPNGGYASRFERDEIVQMEQHGKELLLAHDQLSAARRAILRSDQPLKTAASLGYVQNGQVLVPHTVDPYDGLHTSVVMVAESPEVGLAHWKSGADDEIARLKPWSMIPVADFDEAMNRGFIVNCGRNISCLLGVPWCFFFLFLANTIGATLGLVVKGLRKPKRQLRA